MPPPFEHSLRRRRRAAERGVHDVHGVARRTARRPAIAAPPTSGPVGAHRFDRTRALTIRKRPPRTKIAPPPSIVSFPVDRPFDEREVLHRERRVVLVLAMRRRPDQVRVAGVHVQDPARALAVEGDEPTAVDDDVRSVVEDPGRRAHRNRDGRGPQLKVMIPPWATALTTACEVQLPGVPVPTTRSGSEVSTRPAEAGIGECPVGLPLPAAAGGSASVRGLAGGTRPSGRG